MWNSCKFGKISHSSTSVVWRILKFLYMQRNFRFLNICHVSKSEISPHDPIFLHRYIGDKNQVCPPPPPVSVFFPFEDSALKLQNLKRSKMSGRTNTYIAKWRDVLGCTTQYVLSLNVFDLLTFWYGHSSIINSYQEDQTTSEVH